MTATPSTYPASIHDCRGVPRRRRVVIPPLLIALLTVLAAVGCGTIGLPGGGGGGSTLPDDRVTGEVDRVDTSRRQIVLITSGDRLTTAGDRLALDYDDRTRVVYRGEQYTPANLEPGDEVRAEAAGAAQSLASPQSAG